MSLYFYPHPLLTKPTVNVDETNRHEILSFIDEARALLSALPSALAIAANQCGRSHRMFITAPGKTTLPEIVVNPKWSYGPYGMELDKEGCLSFPGHNLDIRRYKNVLLDYFDEQGNHSIDEFNGLDARIIQHECEHLDGKTFLQNTDRRTKYRIIEAMRKRK